jgi:hypothetical protein
MFFCCRMIWVKPPPPPLPRSVISFFRGSKLVFFNKDMGQTNEQQRHFNEWPISELHGEVDSFQNSLNYSTKMLFLFSAQRTGDGGRTQLRRQLNNLGFFFNIPSTM